MKFFFLSLFKCLFVCLLSGFTAYAENDVRLKIALTTSTENSGLLEHLRPLIREELGIIPHFIISGTGKALRLGKNKDVDMVWVHDEQGEREFMDAGHGERREKIMYSHFVLIGPDDDLAGTRGKSIIQALKNIEKSQSPFISRGDDSGTHRLERKLWQSINPTHPILQKVPTDWYKEVGSSMGSTLNIASAMNAYTISDEATWLKFANKGQLKQLLRDDVALYNPYSVMVVNDTGRHEATILAHKLSDWLISLAGQKAINSYRINDVQAFVGLR